VLIDAPGCPCGQTLRAVAPTCSQRMAEFATTGSRERGAMCWPRRARRPACGTLIPRGAAVVAGWGLHGQSWASASGNWCTGARAISIWGMAGGGSTSTPCGHQVVDTGQRTGLRDAESPSPGQPLERYKET